MACGVRSSGLEKPALSFGLFIGIQGAPFLILGSGAACYRPVDIAGLAGAFYAGLAQHVSHRGHREQSKPILKKGNKVETRMGSTWKRSSIG
jgi:hypothetical protein